MHLLLEKKKSNTECIDYEIYFGLHKLLHVK